MIRNHLRAGRYCILLAIFLQSCASLRPTPDKDFTFVQLTDPQIGFNTAPGKDSLLYLQAVAAVNQLRPDFVVITGDFIHHTGDSSELAAFRGITALIRRDIPVYFLPGNHDVTNNPAPEDVARYKTQYGYDRFQFVHKRTRFVGINTSLIKAGPAALEAEQSTWMKKALSRPERYTRTIVFGHYPFFLNDPGEAETAYNLPPALRRQYLAVFKERGVGIIFAGHYHRNAYGKDGLLEMVTTGAVGKPLGKDPSGFRIITVGKNGVTHEYRALAP
ncbi:metallophosphoesterase [Chitinophaga lutea]